MRSSTGFTLIELLATLAILAVLAAVAIPVAETTVKRTRERELRLALREIRQAIDDYKQAVDDGLIEKQVDQAAYPPNLRTLLDGVPNAKTPSHEKIYFLRRIPRDPLAKAELAPEKTWGLRSYASSAEAPEAGKDVFDVFSLSAETGLNGIPYRQW